MPLLDFVELDTVVLAVVDLGLPPGSLPVVGLVQAGNQTFEDGWQSAAESGELAEKVLLVHWGHRSVEELRRIQLAVLVAFDCIAAKLDVELP